MNERSRLRWRCIARRGAGLDAAAAATAAVRRRRTTVTLSCGFSVLEAANEAVFEAFEETDAGKDVDFKTSYGASGDQSRAVEAGPTPTSCTSPSSPT